MTTETLLSEADFTAAIQPLLNRIRAARMRLYRQPPRPLPRIVTASPPLALNVLKFGEWPVGISCTEGSGDAQLRAHGSTGSVGYYVVHDHTPSEILRLINAAEVYAEQWEAAAAVHERAIDDATADALEAEDPAIRAIAGRAAYGRGGGPEVRATRLQALAAYGEGDQAERFEAGCLPDEELRIVLHRHAFDVVADWARDERYPDDRVDCRDREVDAQSDGLTSAEHQLVKRLREALPGAELIVHRVTCADGEDEVVHSRAYVLARVGVTPDDVVSRRFAVPA